MGRFSREKGKRGGRELAEEFSKTLGVKARRGMQFQGSPDSPDVVTEIPEIHIECKRTECFNLYGALDQAVNDAGTSKIPVVFHRKNKKPWVVVLRLGDLKQLTHILNRYVDNETRNRIAANRPRRIPNTGEYRRCTRFFIAVNTERHLDFRNTENRSHQTTRSGTGDTAKSHRRYAGTADARDSCYHGRCLDLPVIR